MSMVLLQWLGAALGLLGAALLAANVRHSPWGWVFFLASNVAWITFGLRAGVPGMVVMQVGFTLTSLLGVWRWIMVRYEPAYEPAVFRRRRHVC